MQLLQRWQKISANKNDNGWTHALTDNAKTNYDPSYDGQIKII
jgi:hypothetical protein